MKTMPGNGQYEKIHWGVANAGNSTADIGRARAYPKHEGEVVALLHACPCGVAFDSDDVQLFQLFLEGWTLRKPAPGARHRRITQPHAPEECREWSAAVINGNSTRRV